MTRRRWGRATRRAAPPPLVVFPSHTAPAGCMRQPAITTRNRLSRTVMTTFEDISTLRDRDLWLELRAREPAIPARGWVPAYRFAMRLDGVDQAVGRISLSIGNTQTIELYAGHVHCD